MIEDSIESTIDKIKNKEQENHIKLTEKRTLENSIACTSRLLRETISRTTKLNEECLDTCRRRDALEVEVMTAQIRRQALYEQLVASAEELRGLKVKSSEGVSNVWESRNSLCEEVQKVADQCDVWALLTKPKYIEMPPKKQPVIENIEEKSEGKLKKAIERRQKLLEERERLMNEPDHDEKFIRIKNAIRYSEEMTAHMRV